MTDYLGLDLLNQLTVQPLDQRSGLLQQQPLHSLLSSYYEMLMPGYDPEVIRQAERHQREAFYRSASQNWLNAMLDIELGIS